MSTPVVCSAAVDLIVEREVSSQAVHTKRYSGSTWPGGSSGVKTAGLRDRREKDAAMWESGSARRPAVGVETKA